MDILDPVIHPEPTPDAPIATEQTGMSGDIHAVKLQGFFGIANPDTAESTNLSEITRMLDGNSKDAVDFLWEIKNVENRIGTPPLGVSRRQHIFNFIKINSQIKGLEKERDLYV